MSQVMDNAPTKTDRGRTPTVLVVDDEPLICMLASDGLRNAGFRTLEAHNGQQAIDLLEKGEQVDVVFSDVQMPGMDGFELQRWVRQHRPQTRVLLASGVENVKAASGHMGVPRWLVFKPYNMVDLEQRIRDLLRG
jgi:two-component system NtrC family sensor kinase